ncbi:MAG: GTPase HflX [Methylotenera sp.]|nr:GTPase HflX [Oligoflexia bacterium]
MLESTESLLPLKQGNTPLRVVCVGIQDHPLDELERLLSTLDLEIVGSARMASRTVNPATYVGKGKLDEVKALVEQKSADAVIVDIELSPNQLKNIESYLGKHTLDRPGVIIEIFSQHARSKEAKTQVELAKLQYILPRLAHLWTHFERQRGGMGNKGMGETQVEVDRRLVKKRMSNLRERLKDIENERKIQRSGRKDVLKVALVGYTNAGKSTLLNALTQSNVLAENKLFATLDASVRTLDPNSHPPIVAIDTVGFISRLPPSLIASFRSTLEELHEADLLLHVVDGSSPEAREQLEVTEEVLKELKVFDKPRITVLNKMDMIGNAVTSRNLVRVISPGSMALSALNQPEVIKLRDKILQHFLKDMEVYEVVIPYDESRLEALLHAHGSVEKTTHLEKGAFYRVRMTEGWAKKLGLEKYKT